MLTDEQIHQRNELSRQARDFLLALLADDPQPYGLIRQRAAEQGISVSRLLAAKRTLHVRSRRVNERAVWYLSAAI